MRKGKWYYNMGGGNNSKVFQLGGTTVVIHNYSGCNGKNRVHLNLNIL